MYSELTILFSNLTILGSLNLKQITCYCILLTERLLLTTAVKHTVYLSNVYTHLGVNDIIILFDEKGEFGANRDRHILWSNNKTQEGDEGLTSQIL